jgi:hypothetical protein
LIDHGIVFRDIANKPSLIEKLRESSYKDVIEKYLEAVALSNESDYLKKISSQLVNPQASYLPLRFSPLSIDKPHQSAIDALSFYGIALEQMIASPDSIQILVQNFYYRQLFIKYGKDNNLQPLLKICWEYTANQAKRFQSDFNDIQVVKEYFEKFGNGLRYEDFSSEYTDMFKSAENKSQELLEDYARNIALQHAQNGQDLVSKLKLQKFQEDRKQLEKEAIKIMFQNHSDRTSSDNNDVFVAASELKDLLTKGVYDVYLKEFGKAKNNNFFNSRNGA